MNILWLLGEGVCQECGTSSLKHLGRIMRFMRIKDKVKNRQLSCGIFLGR